MDLIVALLMLAFSIGSGVYKYALGGDVSDKLLIQAGIAGAGSLYILIPTVYSHMKNFNFASLFNLNTDKTEEAEDPRSHDSVCITQSDFEALCYLKERARKIKSQEATELVIKLNNILFSAEVQENEE